MQTAARGGSSVLKCNPCGCGPSQGGLRPRRGLLCCRGLVFLAEHFVDPGQPLSDLDPQWILLRVLIAFAHYLFL